MFLWFTVTAVSAALFRSGALTVVTGALSLVTFGGGFDSFGWDIGSHGIWAWWPPFGAAVVFGLSHWTGANRAKHFGYILLVSWIWWMTILDRGEVYAFGVGIVATLIFLALTVPRSPLAVLCGSGYRSSLAVSLLERAGIKAANVPVHEPKEVNGIV